MMKLLKLHELEIGKKYNCIHRGGFTYSQPHRINRFGDLEFLSDITNKWRKHETSDIRKSNYRFTEIKTLEWNNIMDICEEALMLNKDLVIKSSYAGIHTHMVIPNKHIPKIEILDKKFKLREGTTKITFQYKNIIEIYTK